LIKYLLPKLSILLSVVGVYENFQESASLGQEAFLEVFYFAFNFPLAFSTMKLALKLNERTSNPQTKWRELWNLLANLFLSC
jgi:uncharacterized membrane protein